MTLYHLSLPIDLNKKEKYNFEDIVPPGIIPNNYKNIPGEKIILSVGGAEHNRALVYLVNKHRKTCKEKRFIGFCDNVFDLALLENNEEAFLMGLNGPVSGGNSKSFNARTIDNDNFSTGHYIELISFRIEEYRVLSVYGLSALASKLMLEYITARTISYKKETSLYKCLIGEHLSRKYKNEDFCVLFELKKKPIDMEKEIFNILDGEDTFTFLQRKELNFEILDKLLKYYNDNIVKQANKSFHRTRSTRR